MDIKFYDELKNTDYGNVAFELSNALREKIEINKIHSAAIALACILIKKRNEKAPKVTSEVEHIIEKYSSLFSDDVEEILGKYTSEQLLSFILFDDQLSEYRGFNCTTPEGVCKLAAKILDVQNGEQVLELCSGKGSFPVVASRGSDFSYEGVELNYVSSEIAQLRNFILGLNAQFTLCDALEYRTEKKADKIFSNYPFMIRTPAMNEYKELVSKNLGVDIAVLQKASSDWIFNAVAVEQLKEKGKAVVIMTNGSAWNSSDKEIRKFFIENGYIEAVISLPGKLFNDTAIPTTLLVLSKNNKTVRMVDARELCISERRNNVLTNENIEKIDFLLKNDSEISTTKTLQDFENNDYVLNAVRYLEVVPEIKDGVEFGTVISKITRGSQLKAKELDELKAAEKTPYQYLMLSNIHNGLISFDEDGQYMTELPEKLEKYCIQNNAIVLSKIGMPSFKSAVAQVEDGSKLLANGNLFVIEIDEEKADPFYIQAFFASDAGVALFKSIYTGAVIPSISMDKLKKMIIPLPSLEKQKQIADRYAATLDEVALLRRKLERVSAKLSHIYDEGV